MAGECSRKPAANVNIGLLLRGQAGEQLRPFSIPEPGGVGLLLAMVCTHQWGHAETPTGFLDPLSGSSSTPGSTKNKKRIKVLSSLSSSLFFIPSSFAKSLSELSVVLPNESRAERAALNRCCIVAKLLPCHHRVIGARLARRSAVVIIIKHLQTFLQVPR